MVRVETTGDLRVDQIMPVLCSSWAIMLFEECLQDRIGRYKKLKKKDIKPTGGIPVVDQGEKFIAGYVDNADDVYKGSLPVIIFGDHTRRIKFIDFSFAVGADGTKILKPIDELSPKFFYYYLGSLNLESQGYSRHYRFLKQTKIPIPSLAEQRRIVAKLEKLLEKVDACKERLEKIPAILKRFRQSVLAAACSGRLTTDWRQRNAKVEPALSFLRRLSKEGSVSAKSETAINPIGDIEYLDLPAGWIYASLSAISLSITDGDHQPPPKAASGIPFITISNISRGSLDLADTMFVKAEYYENLRENRSPRIGDVLYSVTGSYGIAVLVETDERFCFQRHIALVRPHPLMSNKYIFFVMSSGFAYRQATEVATGIAQLTVPLSGLRKLKIPIPPREEQHEIVRRVEALFKIAADIEKRYEKAKAHVDKLTQSILAKAFRGELVPQDPNDEPASELLKRIQEERKKEEPEGRPSRRGSRRRRNN